MNKFLFLFLFIFTSLASGDVQYTKFIDSQLLITYEMNENNITKEKIEALINKQNMAYENALDIFMSNKNKFINTKNIFDLQMFSLKKIISINKRAGNAYAVLRDEIKLKSYKVMQNQNLMFQEVLLGLDTPSIDSFELKLNKAVQKNQVDMHKIYEKDYLYLNDTESTSSIIIKVKKNLQEFYALRDINVDMIINLYKLKYKMYRLNKYVKYHLIGIAIYINNIAMIENVNITLETYNLSVLKLLLITFLIVLIYFFRRALNFVLKSYLLKMDIFNAYSKEIMDKLYKPIDLLVIVVNINMVVYVYNNFSKFEDVTRIFNIAYVLLLTYMIYKIANTVAALKVTEIGYENKIKNEMVNVSIKILNFVIVILGFLIVLYFAGVNLTAVLSGLGIGGFAVAFAAKDSISNFFGTLSILFSDVFSQGDWIVVGKDEGVVVEIGLRVTTLRTFDNALIAIPNGTFATADVKNWTRRTLGRRIKMSIGVKYDSKSQDIKNAVSEIRVMLDKHPGIATKNTKYEYRKSHRAKLLSKDDHEGVKKTLLVYLDEFGPSSMNILIYCFTKTVRWQEWLAVKEDVMHQIMEILERNTLEFAFPSLSIYNEKNE